jgi:protoporphyrinogen/coproporphyrinogen III oxidase
MSASTQAPVAIVGGGPAGLSAAAFLHQHQVPFVLYEAGKQVAGLAASFHDTDGFSYDFWAHFITNRLAAAIGVGAQCRDVNYYGETVLIGGKTYSYPFGLLQNPKYLTSGLVGRIGKSQKRANSSAAEWFRANYGKTLANDVAIPLLEEWSGADASELAASVGDKLQNTIGQTMTLKAASYVTKRAVGCGYSHELRENPYVWHVYPEGGVGLLCQKLASGLEDSIHLESPVQEILVESNRAIAVKSNGQEQPVSAVVSTAPCHILAKMVKGSDRLAHLAKFRYRPMVFVNMRFGGRGYLPDTVLWTPESDFLFFRLTETPLSMPWLAPAGKTLITVDIGCQIGDDIWTMDEEELGRRCLEHLKSIIPQAIPHYLGCRVLRTPFAYPVHLNEYEVERQALEHSTGIDGLYTIGRNGEFSHALMEDVYWRSRRKMLHLMNWMQARQGRSQASPQQVFTR